MFELTYSEIYSSFYSKVEAYDIGELTEQMAYAILDEWLHSVLAEPRLMKFWYEIADDEENRTLQIDLNKSSGSDSSDKLYIKTLLATGVALKWAVQKYNSALNTSQVFGGKEEKYYSQANHMEAILNMRNQLEAEFYKLLRDYGVYHNDYVD